MCFTAWFVTQLQREMWVMTLTKKTLRRGPGLTGCPRSVCRVLLCSFSLDAPEHFVRLGQWLYLVLILVTESRSSFRGSVCWIKCHILLFSLTHSILLVCCPPISPPGLTLPRWHSPWGGTKSTRQPRPANQPACPRRVQLAVFTATCLESFAPTPLVWRTVWCQDGGRTRRGCAKPP